MSATIISPASSNGSGRSMVSLLMRRLTIPCMAVHNRSAALRAVLGFDLAGLRQFGDELFGLIKHGPAERALAGDRQAG